MDIAIKWDNEAFRGDWVIGNGGFQTETGLRTGVLVSLFTDRRAPPDWIPPAGSPPDRGGFFGDTYRRRPIGSWLWLLYRSSIGDRKAFLAQVRNYCLLALQWLIEDGISASNEIITGWVAPGIVGIEGVITRPSGVAVRFSYAWLWQQGASAAVNGAAGALTDEAGNALTDETGGLLSGS